MQQAILEWMSEKIPVILLGIFGGLVRQINEKHTETRIFISCIVTSAFVALLVSWSLDDLQISANLKAVIIGISGYSAVQVLAIINRAVLDRMQKISEGKDDTDS
jgi:small basic protein